MSHLRSASMSDHPEPPPPATEPELELACEEYLARVAGGEAPELAAFAARLDTEELRSAFRVEALAGEWLWRRENGEEPALDELLARLAGDGERARLREALAGAQVAARRLPWRLEPGSRVGGRYEVLELVGMGGNGVVYLARDLELERRVALKAVRVDPTKDVSELARNLVHESRTLAALRSPNIVTVFDVLRERDRVCLVLDFVDGVDLSEVVAELAHAWQGGAHEPADRLHIVRALVARGGAAPTAGVFAETDWYRLVAAILVRLASAIERAHDAGVLHRDLKSKNVMLGVDGEPVLLDFGFAHRAGRPSEGFRGTPPYVAPEQIEAHATGEDPRTDVYAFGLLAYELIGLRQAFPQAEGEGWKALSERIVGRRFPSLRSLDPRAPRALVAICEKAMAAEPARRYASMGELRADLERFLRGLPPRAAPVEWWWASGMRARSLARRPALLVGLALLAAGAAGVGALWPEPVGLFVESGLVHRPGSSVRPLADNEELQGDEQLGVRLNGDRRGIVYALSVFGKSPDVLYVRPTRPRLMSDRDELRPTRGGWGVVVPPGLHDLACAELDAAEDYTFEGFEVLVCPDEDPGIDELMDGLARLESEERIVLYGQYRKELEQKHRGGAPSRRKYHPAPEGEVGVHLYRRIYQVAR